MAKALVVEAAPPRRKALSSPALASVSVADTPRNVERMALKLGGRPDMLAIRWSDTEAIHYKAK